METTEQPISQPACFKCDDLGYVPGGEVFGVARCDCPAGAELDMRATQAFWSGTISPRVLNKSESMPGAIVGIMLDPGPPEYVFGNGALRVSTSGMTYNGELIKDAGRAYRAFIATMEGRKPDEPLLSRAYDLIDEARAAGQVLTIDLVPLKPLAMGHYEMVADLRQKRERALTGRVLMAVFESDLARPLNTVDLRPARERAETLIGFDMAQDGTECTVESVRDNETGIITITSRKYAPPLSGSEIEARCNAMPLKTMMFPDRRQKAPDYQPVQHKSPKVIWPKPDPKNFTLERHDAFSTLTDEQFDKRQSDRRKREAK